MRRIVLHAPSKDKRSKEPRALIAATPSLG